MHTCACQMVTEGRLFHQETAPISPCVKHKQAQTTKHRDTGLKQKERQSLVVGGSHCTMCAFNG